MHRNAKRSKSGQSRNRASVGNARRLPGIFFFDPDDEKFKRFMKNVSRKLEIPMPAPMPCKLQLHKHKETCCTLGQHKTKYACIVEADESMRIRMKGSQSKNHEDHIAGKGMNSSSHKNLLHKFIRMPQAMKYDRCKGSTAVEK